MIVQELIDVLKDNGYSGKERVYNKEITTDELSFAKLRDKLLPLGKFLFEDQSNHIFIIAIKQNLFSNTVTVAIKWKPKIISLCGYSAEGLIKYNSVDKAFERIEKAVTGEISLHKKSYKKFVIMGICAVVLLVITIIVFNAVNLKPATDSYNQAVDIFNQTVDNYNAIAVKGDLKAVSDLPESMEKIVTQNTDLFSLAGAVFNGNSKEKIEKDTKTVRNITEDNKNAIKIVNQLICPKQDYIEQKLKTLDTIKGIEAVTKYNNPDGMLGKDGGYYGCLYFTANQIDESSIPGKSIVDKGTDAGGAVELYSTLGDAKKRCEYLASFDGTILTTGSYVLVGTMVIRTSFKLDANEQYQLTDNIINAITTI